MILNDVKFQRLAKGNKLAQTFVNRDADKPLINNLKINKTQILSVRRLR